MSKYKIKSRTIIMSREQLEKEVYQTFKVITFFSSKKKDKHINDSIGLLKRGTELDYLRPDGTVQKYTGYRKDDPLNMENVGWFIEESHAYEAYKKYLENQN